MERTIFRYILSHSLKQQLIVLVLTLSALPFYFASLDLPKQIINKAIDADAEKFPASLKLLGFEWGRFGQLELLAWLCGLFLFLVLINGGFKYVINLYKGLLGERMLRRLRYQLFSTILHFPLSRFREVSEAEMVSIISSEVEPLGGFIGDAFAQPLYQGGLLLTALLFIFVQDPTMGLAVIALYPIQAAIIPRLQYQVNQLGKRRVREVRRLSNDIAESVSMAREIQLNSTGAYERAEFTRRLGKIFDIRYQIYRKKFFIKFLNNFLAQLTPFFFFSLGGYFVIDGRLSLGALIAVLAAYKDLAPPWKELLDFYQQQQDARIKYEQIILRFGGNFVDEPHQIRESPDSIFDGDLVAEQLFVTGDGRSGLNGATFTIPAGSHVAVTGPADSGKAALAEVVAGLTPVDSGSLSLGGHNLFKLPLATRAAAIAYADGRPAFLDRSLFDNLVYGLKIASSSASKDHPSAGSADNAARREAIYVGNSPDDVESDWIDYERLGVASGEELVDRILEAIHSVEMDRDLIELGLQTVVPVGRISVLSDGIVRARAFLSNRIEALNASPAVELFDSERFNDNASIAENVIFGEPIGDKLNIHRLVDNPHVRRVIRKTHLEAPLIRLGYELAQRIAMADMQGASFEPLPAQFRVEPEDIPEFRRIMARTHKNGVDGLRRRDRRRLQSLALCLVSNHEGGHVVTDDIKQLTLEARKSFASGLPGELASSVALFDRNAYNPVLSVRENIVFGKFVDGNRASSTQINNLILEALDEVGMTKAIMEAGLEFRLGARGSRLSEEQRLRLSLVRCLIKKPKIMIVNDVISGFDDEAQRRLIGNVRGFIVTSSLLWVLQDPGLRTLFDGSVELQNGKVLEHPPAG